MPKPMRWAIVVIWLGLAAVFVWREARQAGAPGDLDAAAAAIAGGDADQEWYGLYVEQPGGRRDKIGYAAVEREQTSTGFVTRSSTYMKMAVQGAERIVRTESKALTGFDHRLKYIDFSLRSDALKFKVIGTMRGKNLELEIQTAGDTRRQPMQVPEPPLMPDTLVELLASRGGLRVGATADLPFFDPATFRYDRAHVRVTKRIEHTTPDGKKIVAYRVQTELAGATAEEIVDEAGRTIEQKLAGIVMVREPYQTALTEGWRSLPADLPELARVKVDRPIPKPRDLKYLKVRMVGVDLSDLPIGDERQTFADNVLTVTVPPPLSRGGFRLPYTGLDAALKNLLKPTPLLEVDDPMIQAKAHEIVPPGADALSAAWAIYRWVYENLEKKPVISMTSARDVLLIRRGDCNEHASLFAALARAAGLPAEIRVGLVYANGAFYYHAWNGVYIGQWVSVDATFGQFPADATHLRIVSGGLDRQVDLVRLMGKLSIQLLEYK